MEKMSKKKSIEEQRKLMNDWFKGKYFIQIEPNESEYFFNYISFYDNRFIDNKEEINHTRYYAWRFANSLHHHQLEFATEENYWGGKKLKFSQVEDYIKQNGELQKLFQMAKESSSLGKTQ